MAYKINCECGAVLTGETQDEVVENGQAHIKDAHPDMVDSVSREDLVALVEEA